ncbi:g10763 [Coccomyxa elongata]
MKCAGCEMKWYCSKKCQKEHWKLGHKLYCEQDPNRPAAEPLTENVLESASRQGFMPLQMQVPRGSYIP